jgi:hypothetical protein
MLLPPEGLKQKGLPHLDRGRRHRLDESGHRRSPLGGQPRDGLLRGGARDQLAQQLRRDGHHQPRHHLHQRGAQARRHRVVGGPRRSAPEPSPGLARPPVETRSQGQGRKCHSGQPTPTAASPRPSPIVRPTPSATASTTACPSTPSSLADAARPWRPWSTKRSTGTTACTWAPAWPASEPRPSSALWARSGATPWPCSPSAATTWPTTSATGWTWARGSSSSPRSST